jgi:asparagine synthase (glutamine-hydrolysing)
MCGIAGFIDFNGTSSEAILKSMADAIIHRGPDDSGCELHTALNAQIGLGFRRLSIIDLSPLGHQPMHSANKRVTVIFNGEVYNYQEIKKVLEAAGYSFRSNSDTEVIINAYLHWGISCVDRFIGMFAITLYDHKLNKVYLIRDRAGVKPVHVYNYGGLILFGSELKSFHRHPGFKKEINVDALSLYLQIGYISAPHSIFKYTRKLQPGHYLEIDLATRQTQEVKYWDVFDAYNKQKSDISYDEALNETETILKSAFKYRMIADVPVGVFLSGGYDSTAVTALLQSGSGSKIKTFTIGFDDPKYDESKHAQAVAKHLGTEHHEYICTYKDALDIVPELPHIYDEPFGDISALPTTLVSRMARREVTVALSADGGDEIFAGYPKYFNAIERLKQIGKLPSALKLLSGFLQDRKTITQQDKWSKLTDFLGSNDPIKQFEIIMQSTSYSETKRLLKSDISRLHTYYDDGAMLNDTNDVLSRFQAVEYKTYMCDDILQKVDRATMSASLEGREPFLDQRIIEFAATLPVDHKYRNGEGKFILKDLVHKYVPESIMKRPKMGFGSPLEKWMRVELRDMFSHYMSDAFIRKQNIFVPERIAELRDSFLSGAPISFDRIAFIFLFQMWWERWMDQQSH